MNDKVRPHNSEFEGDAFEGYNRESDAKVGVQEYTVVDMFKRDDEDGSWFGRVMLRSVMRKGVIGRAEYDFGSDITGLTQAEFLKTIGLMAAALVEDMNSKGDMFSVTEVVTEAVTYADFKWREIRGET
jgi:hypothetical protein